MTQEKQITIAESVLQTYDSVIRSLKTYPKKNKYFFTRNYSRGKSRRDRIRRNQSLFNIAFSSYMGAARIAAIASSPIPKFEKGGVV